MTLIHPLLKKLATEPSMFVEHASAYASLATLEAVEAGLAWRRRAVAWLVCGLLAMLALAFSGLAVMLVAALPWQGMPAPWVLVGLPVALWALSGVLWWIGSRPPQAQAFMHLRQQWAADTQLVRDAAQTP